MKFKLHTAEAALLGAAFAAWPVIHALTAARGARHNASEGAVPPPRGPASVVQPGRP